jgi:hypothetical protein
VPGFEDAWSAVDTARDGEVVSPEMKPLLRGVYFAVLSTPLDRSALKSNLEQLLEFLVGPGRTNANCWAVDLFFMSSAGWERDWTDQTLPDEFHDVLSLMGQALHDTVKAPQIAANFDCLPEQLLDRVRKIL